MSIDTLKKLIQVPDEPVDTGKGWENVERKINCLLPDDFKLFFDSYGTGAIGDFLWVLNPKSSNGNLNFNKSLYFHTAYKQMKELFPDDYKRPNFPEKESFLTWAVSDNGDSLFWIISSDNPNDWKVGVHNHDQGEEETFDMNASDFLISLAEKKLSSKILPEDFLNSSITFNPL